MTTFLDKVREHKLREVEAAVTSGEADAASRATPLRARGLFAAALGAPGRMSVISEIKRASPSAGDIRADLDPVALARRYVAGGAAAISVLTEPHWFKGSLADLRAVAAAVEAPVLRKDFILDPVQIDVAVANGASAVLLIAAFVSPDRLAQLVAHAHARGLDALVEIFAEEELEAALDAGTRLLGVNARNLKTLEVDRDVVLRIGPRLAELVAAGRLDVTVAESGIQRGAHARAAWEVGYRAALVGEALVRAPDPAALLRELSLEGAT